MCQVKPHINSVGNKGKLVQKGHRISQRMESRFELVQPASWTFDSVRLAVLLIFFKEGINEWCTHKPVSQTILCCVPPTPPNPCLVPPGTLSGCLVTRSQPWYGLKKNTGATWHHPRLWLQTGRPFGRGCWFKHYFALGSFCKCIISLQTWAQGLRHGAPASNGKGPSTYSPYT